MSPEQIGLIAILAITLTGLWLFGRWLFSGKPAPDPWDEETEAHLHQADAIPICTRCLEPQESNARFCHNCGLPADALVPFSPYLYIFALGDVLATGTTRNFKVNWLTVTGYLLLSAANYAFFAPFYWFFFLRNLQRMRVPVAPPVLPPGPPPLSPGDSRGLSS